MSNLKRPNVLFILTDQQRYDTIAANGNSQVFTPNLDRLSAEGVVFDRAYTSSPECVPARAVMMTGQMPHRTACFSNSFFLSPEAVTFQRLLRQSGYTTQAIGKMHFKPTREGFGLEHLTLSEEIPETVDEDEFLTDLHEAGFDWAEEPHGMRSHMYYIPQVSQLPGSLHTTTWTGDRTVDFIRDQAGAGGEKPWLCWTGFIKPHPPFDPTVPFNTLYDPIEMPLPVSGADDESSRNWYQKIQNRAKWMDQGPDAHLQQAQKAHYWALVSMIDVQVGRILDSLEATGQRDNTLIIFTSDHGEFLGDHGCYGKRSWYEGPGRIPMIVSWPGGNLPAGQRRTQLVSHEDILPTILDAAGIDVPRECQGRSLIAAARRADDKGREVLFAQLGDKAQGLYLAMDSEWKYIFCAADNSEQLWHYAADPTESVNYASDPAHAAAKARLKAALIGYFKQEGYADPLDGDDWRRYAAAESDYERALHIGKTDRAIKAGARQYASWNGRRDNVFKPQGRMTE